MPRAKSVPIRKAMPMSRAPQSAPAARLQAAYQHVQGSRPSCCESSPKLLLSLPREVMITLLVSNRLCVRDYAALESTCTALFEACLPLNERLLVAAARAAAARLLRDWRPEAVEAVLSGRCGKRALCFAAAATEGRRCSIAAGAAHTLALPREMPDAPATECAIGLDSVGGDWTESFNGSLLRLWVGPSAAADPGCRETRVFAYGTFLHGHGELRGEVRLGPTRLPHLAGIWRQHGAELGQGKFELRLSECGRQLVGSASSHTGWSGAWSAVRVGVHVGGVGPCAAAGCSSARGSLAVAGTNSDGQCGQRNGRRAALQPAGPPGLGEGARLASAHAASTHSALLCTDGALFLAGSNRHQALGLSRDATGSDDCAPQQSLQQWMQFVAVQQGAATASNGGLPASSAVPGSAAAASLAIAAAEATTLAVQDAFAHAFARISDEELDAPAGEPPVEGTSSAQLHGMLAAFYQYIDDDIHVHTPHTASGNPSATDAPQATARTFCRWTPVPWPGGARVAVARVAVGAHHTLAVADDGALWSWGCNASGQTGDTRGLAEHGPAKQDVLQCGGDLACDGGRSHKRWWGGGQGQWMAADVAAGRDHSLLLTRSGEVPPAPRRPRNPTCAPFHCAFAVPPRRAPRPTLPSQASRLLPLPAHSHHAALMSETLTRAGACPRCQSDAGAYCMVDALGRYSIVRWIPPKG